MKRNILSWAERKKESCVHNSFPLKLSEVAARGRFCRLCVFVQSRTSFAVLFFPWFKSDCIDIVRNTFSTSDIHLLLADFGSKVQKLLKLLWSVLKVRSRQTPPWTSAGETPSSTWLQPIPSFIFPCSQSPEVRYLWWNHYIHIHAHQPE